MYCSINSANRLHSAAALRSQGRGAQPGDWRETALQSGAQQQGQQDGGPRAARPAGSPRGKEAPKAGTDSADTRASDTAPARPGAGGQAGAGPRQVRGPARAPTRTDPERLPTRLWRPTRASRRWRTASRGRASLLPRLRAAGRATPTSAGLPQIPPARPAPATPRSVLRSSGPGPRPGELRRRGRLEPAPWTVPVPTPPCPGRRGRTPARGLCLPAGTPRRGHRAGGGAGRGSGPLPGGPGRASGQVTPRARAWPRRRAEEFGLPTPAGGCGGPDRAGRRGGGPGRSRRPGRGSPGRRLDEGRGGLAVGPRVLGAGSPTRGPGGGGWADARPGGGPGPGGGAPHRDRCLRRSRCRSSGPAGTCSRL